MKPWYVLYVLPCSYSIFVAGYRNKLYIVMRALKCVLYCGMKQQTNINFQHIYISLLYTEYNTGCLGYFMLILNIGRNKKQIIE